MSKVKIRKAVLNDADEIANVLLDFYNILKIKKKQRKFSLMSKKKNFIIL